MNGIIESIVIRDFDGANSIIEESLQYIIERKMVEKKKMIMAERNAWNNMPNSRQEKLYRDVLEMDISKLNPENDSIEDRRPTQKPEQAGKGDKQPTANSNSSSATSGLKEETIDEARIKIVKARIRGGKIQRRKRVSNVPGMTLRGGSLKRMSAAERRHRKLGQRKGKLKRRAKMARTLMKRQRSLRKRKSLGI